MRDKFSINFLVHFYFFFSKYVKATCGVCNMLTLFKVKPLATDYIERKNRYLPPYAVVRV